MRPSTVTVDVPKNVAVLWDDDQFEDNILSDIDKAFTQIEMSSGPTRKKGKTTKAKKKKTASLAQMQATFVEISRVHLQPVIRYLKAIQQGVVTKDLCELVHYVIGPMVGKTRKTRLKKETEALLAFQRKLKVVVKSSARKIKEEDRLALAKVFGPVKEAFDLDFRGHAPAVVNILGFYRVIRRKKAFSEKDISKLFSVGIPSLSMIRKSSIAELVSLSGIGAEKIFLLRKEARNFSIVDFLS